MPKKARGTFRWEKKSKIHRCHMKGKFQKKKKGILHKGQNTASCLNIHRCHEWKIPQKRRGALTGARYCFVLICQCLSKVFVCGCIDRYTFIDLAIHKNMHIYRYTTTALKRVNIHDFKYMITNIYDMYICDHDMYACAYMHT